MSALSVPGVPFILPKRLTAKERKRKAAQAALDAAGDSHLTLNEQPNVTTVTLITSSGVRTETQVLPPEVPPPSPLRLSPPIYNEPPEPPPIPLSSSESLPKKPKTQTSEQLEEFREAMPRLSRLILSREADVAIGSPCHCGQGIQSTQCKDCTDYRSSCTECFITAHRERPFHWARVWDEEKGFFVRRDISTLRPHGYAIHLGHHGDDCPNPASDIDLFFHVVDTNGIHNTKIRFCRCAGSPDRLEQLVKCDLFPATVKRPTMAFTFAVLHQFHVQHLESKISAYDFIGSLRRLTDNAFASQVSDPYPQFRLVMRVWRFLTAEKRLGQAHGIDNLIPNRPDGTMVVYCPSCPQIGFNLEVAWHRTPKELRHLNQSRKTADGNFHAGSYVKNTDPDDVSLYSDKAYFPDDADFKAYLKKHAGQVEDDCPCSHLEVLNKATRKKYRNMQQSGVVNIQCRHVFIESTVDLQLGEKFINTDYALAHALRKHRNFDDIEDMYRTASDTLVSYDVSCAYWINIINRFRLSFPDLVPAIEKIRWLIPLVHVRNHKDNCMYNFASSYIINAGHFHGETAEHYWPECNQLGGQIRQMNNGHRQETLIDHHSDWNWKKTMNMSSQLAQELSTAKTLFLQKRDHFKGLCELYADKIDSWDTADRHARPVGQDKEVICVYRYNHRKVPSQDTVYQFLLGLESKSKSLAGSSNQGASALFLHEGLVIESLQYRIRGMITDQRRESSPNGEKEIKCQREKLRARLNDWRSIQTNFIPTINEFLSHSSTKNPEEEKLYLPSDFLSSQRTNLGLNQLAHGESQLREGAAFDALARVQTAVKVIVVLRDRKKKDAHGQEKHTRALSKIHLAESKRDRAMSEYNRSRQALIALDVVDAGTVFPALSLQDTFRKSTLSKRSVGDSRRTDGVIWTYGGINGQPRHSSSNATSTADPTTEAMLENIPPSGTQGSKAKKRVDAVTTKKQKGTKRRVGTQDSPAIDKESLPLRNIEDGWIWQLGAMGRLSTQELADWVQEGDRVQWFRAEAEMQRWLEEWELIQAEFLRCIRAFQKSHQIWTHLAASNISPGHAAYALKTAAMFAKMEVTARNTFIAAGYGHLLLKDDKWILADYVEEERSKLSAALGRPVI